MKWERRHGGPFMTRLQILAVSGEVCDLNSAPIGERQL